MTHSLSSVFVSRKGQNRGSSGREIVPYVPVEGVERRLAKRVVEERVELPLNVNVFGFVRSTMTQAELNSLYLKYCIDSNMYRLSIICLSYLLNTSYIPFFVGSPCRFFEFY